MINDDVTSTSQSDDVLDTRYGLVTLWIIEIIEQWANYLRSTVRNTTT
jgi:hypothetical protein